ncbi:MAG: hypothetical protein ABH884_00005 [Candidatus Komeilibacteria bacterium]
MQKVFNISEWRCRESIIFDKKITSYALSIEAADSYFLAFITAPDEAAIRQCITLDKGRCANQVRARRFQYGKIYYIKYGDPIYMLVVPVNRKKIGGYFFKIFRLLKHNGELSDVYLYVDISDIYCTCADLEIIEEIK